MSVATAQRNGKASFREPDFSDEQIREVAGKDAATIAQWAVTVAKERGIRVRKRPLDKFVKAVSRLCDGVELDSVEELLVELSRAGVISSFQRGLLQLHYLQ